MVPEQDSEHQYAAQKMSDRESKVSFSDVWLLEGTGQSYLHVPWSSVGC